jgi:hypothetical protein
VVKGTLCFANILIELTPNVGYLCYEEIVYTDAPNGPVGSSSDCFLSISIQGYQELLNRKAFLNCK